MTPEDVNQQREIDEMMAKLPPEGNEPNGELYEPVGNKYTPGNKTSEFWVTVLFSVLANTLPIVLTAVLQQYQIPAQYEFMLPVAFAFLQSVGLGASAAVVKNYQDARARVKSVSMMGY